MRKTNNIFKRRIVMRKSTRIALVFGGLLLIAQGSAWAIAIDVVPQMQEVTAGSSVNVDIAISGLGDMVAPSVSAYDIDIFFDPSILSFDSVAFSDQLDVFGFGDITSVDASVSGTVNLFELSLDLPSDLDALQLSAFTLATLTFDANTAGTSAISLGLNALGDGNGDPLTAIIQGSSVNVTPAPTTVPEPAAWLLFGLGMLGMLIYRPR
jgi:hypothetical protein